MEIIARLREEREILVARVAQIDKMLRQYDEWGREAQRLLSLTGAPVFAGGDENIVSAAPSEIRSAKAPSERERGMVVDEEGSAGALASLSVAAGKTPIPEFEAAVIEVLREAGKPMDRVELYEALTARGIVIGDGNRDKELNALSARVYRMARESKNRISGERGQGYRLLPDDWSAPMGVDVDSSADDEDIDELI